MGYEAHKTVHESSGSLAKTIDQLKRDVASLDARVKKLESKVK